MAKPVTDSEKLHPSLNYPESTHWVEKEVIHKIFNSLFGKPEDSPTMNKVKQNIYTERKCSDAAKAIKKNNMSCQTQLE